MKIFAELPPTIHYRRAKSSEKILFVDKATSLLEIESPVAEPWGRKWVIMLGIKKGKNTQVTVAGKMRLRLFEGHQGDLPEMQIARSFAYGKFDYPPRDSKYHMGFPVAVINLEECDRGGLPTYKWLQYDLFDAS